MILASTRWIANAMKYCGQTDVCLNGRFPIAERSRGIKVD